MNPSEKKEQKSLFQDIQEIANKIKDDVEKQLKTVFKRWEVTEHQALPTENPEGSSYQMKVQTDDKDQSNLKLSTSRRSLSAPWETVVDEFFRGVSPFDGLLAPFDSSLTGFDSIQSLADSLKKDVEKDLNMTFDTFDVMESHPILTDPEHTSYYMRVKTDDNGQVRIKTIKKVPGSDWETHVEEFTRGKALGSQGQKAKSLEGKGQKMETEGKEMAGQRMETEKIGRKGQDTIIEEEPLKASSTQPSA